jgi:hypothetical protein
MSSGEIERNYLKNVENNFLLSESVIVTNYNLQKSIYSEPKLYTEDFNKDNRSSLEERFKCYIDDYLELIKEIHFILKKSHDLTIKQKIAYCNSQRYYMKLFLKEISKKFEN